MVTGKNRQFLLEIAHQAVGAAIAGEKYIPPQTDEQELLANLGCFVTLKIDDELRGCIGTFTSNEPLITTVAKMARSSTVEDYRFANNKLTKKDLSNLQIEISVLSELKLTAKPLSLELGTHGIYITKGGRSGCLLPQVATESGWSKEEFLSYCCAYKAGIPANAWKDRSTKVYLFTAEIIS